MPPPKAGSLGRLSLHIWFPSCAWEPKCPRSSASRARLSLAPTPVPKPSLGTRMEADHMADEKFRGTTILMVRRGDKVAVAGDGQVTLGDMVMKHQAKKVRKLYHGKIIVGFAGLRRRRPDPVRAPGGQAGEAPGQPHPVGGGTGQGLAHRPDSAAPGGPAPGGGRHRRAFSSPAPATSSSPTKG